MEMVPRTFFFAGKGHQPIDWAKLIIKFINNLRATIDGDPSVRGESRSSFCPELQRLPGRAADSGERRLEPDLDCGYEASGTSNMSS